MLLPDANGIVSLNMSWLGKPCTLSFNRLPDRSALQNLPRSTGIVLIELDSSPGEYRVMRAQNLRTKVWRAVAGCGFGKKVLANLMPSDVKRLFGDKLRLYVLTNITPSNTIHNIKQPNLPVAIEQALHKAGALLDVNAGLSDASKTGYKLLKLTYQPTGEYFLLKSSNKTVTYRTESVLSRLRQYATCTHRIENMPAWGFSKKANLRDTTLYRMELIGTVATAGEAKQMLRKTALSLGTEKLLSSRIVHPSEWLHPLHLNPGGE